MLIWIKFCERTSPGGDAIEPGWNSRAMLEGWGGPKLLASCEAERRGARNVSASRYASAEVEQRKLNEMIGAELG